MHREMADKKVEEPEVLAQPLLPFACPGSGAARRWRTGERDLTASPCKARGAGEQIRHVKNMSAAHHSPPQPQHSVPAHRRQLVRRCSPLHSPPDAMSETGSGTSSTSAELSYDSPYGHN